MYVLGSINWDKWGGISDTKLAAAPAKLTMGHPK
jgi:hypothetical protein